jgi:hypothetical protein
MLEELDFEEMEMGFVGRKSKHSFCTGSSIDFKE